MWRRVIASVNGKKFFQIKCINWSYRNRGYDARIHKNKIDNVVAFKISSIVDSSGCDRLLVVPRNKIVDSVFIRRIFEYSAKKNKAKGPPAYSTLNPETNSDSPSVKSNGARLVSASVEINHIAAIGQAGIINHINSCVKLKLFRLKLPVIKTKHRIIKPNVTSYEIVCATARNAPISAYLEFEAQPEPKIEYTVKLDKASKNRIVKFRFDMVNGIGSGIQIASDKVRAIIGISINRICEEVEGRIGSLINSFKPSAIGWSRPIGPTILGPFRSCIYPKTFRSTKVKNATANSTGIIYIRGLMNWVTK